MQTYKTMLTLVPCVLLAGCALFGDKEPTATLRFHEQCGEAIPNKLSREVIVPKTGLSLVVERYPALTERDVQDASVVQTAGGPAILLRLETNGMWRLDEVTTRSRGRYLVIFLNARPVAAWLVEKRLNNGVFLLEGDFTEDEAKKACQSINKQREKRDSLW